MRILVDARVFSNVGVARYLRALASRWLLDSQVDGIRFLGDPGTLKTWLDGKDPRGISRVGRWTDAPFSVRAQLRWATRLHRNANDVDVTFFPYHDAPLFRHPSPSVVTIHDLTPFVLPRAFPAWKRLAGGVLVDGALRNADRVVTGSENSRDDILARAPDVAPRVAVIPHGVDSLFRPLEPEERTAVEERWDRLRPFLLAVGSARPHKNLELAVEILAQVRATHPEVRLVIAGPQDRRVRSVLRRARARGVLDAVELVGALEDERLREAYALAELFLFPSLYEGFGLPPLEAMACGTPVVASDRGPLPEVLGDGAVLLDPLDREAWEGEATRLLDDAGERRARVEAGLRKAREYSWDRAADETLAVLRDVAERGPHASREGA